MDSFGAKLKREREKRKISLDDVSAATKISNRFLSAIESDRFDQLPGGIFNRGFIRAYARHLSLDEDQTISDYLAASGEDDPNAPVEPEQAQRVWAEENSNPATSLPWRELAALLLLAVVGIAYWQFRVRESNKPSQATAANKPIPANDATTPPVASTSKENNDHITSAALAGVVAKTNSTSQPFQLRIISREDSWISISGPQGEILHQILSPPEEKSFTSRSRVVVKAGNVGGLDFVWNGHSLPSQGKEGEVRTLIFDGTGIHIPPPPAPLQPDSLSPN